jgi:hypothetical protein
VNALEIVINFEKIVVIFVECQYVIFVCVGGVQVIVTEIWLKNLISIVEPDYAIGECDDDVVFVIVGRDLHVFEI